MSSDERMRPSGALGDALRHRDELHAALVGLEKALAAPAVSREAEWLDRVRAAVGRVRGAFHSHVKVTEAEDGLFGEIVSEAPRLVHHVDVLRAEHREIEDELERVESEGGSGDPVEVRDHILGLLGRMARHRQKGADLLYEAYEVDIGFAD